jgi:FAD/FMN-containing dehydrogenase
VTIGAGQDFQGVYEFAEANNITVVGGSALSVGAAGGWINGGGHSALSNRFGLGVDNALEIKAVLPNGKSPRFIFPVSPAYIHQELILPPTDVRIKIFSSLFEAEVVAPLG